MITERLNELVLGNVLEDSVTLSGYLSNVDEVFACHDLSDELITDREDIDLLVKHC